MAPTKNPPTDPSHASDDDTTPLSVGTGAYWPLLIEIPSLGGYRHLWNHLLLRVPIQTNTLISMTIAIQAADLDANRIDGTRIYLLELLKRLGPLAPNEHFSLYHKTKFNFELTPPTHRNYSTIALPFPSQWMQTRFALEMFRVQPERIFFPVQAVPIFLPKKSIVTITIHDLAFKKYPETFTRETRFKLNFLLDRAIKRADHIIAVSQATRNDLLFFFPQLPQERIHVIYHGFDQDRFSCPVTPKSAHHILATYGLLGQPYLLSVGALQPRKNLVRLIAAFNLLKTKIPTAKLVLAGEPAWLSEPIFAAQAASPYHSDILMIGKIPSAHLPSLYQSAHCFAFPSLYEGFGLPLLEAFASGTPVLTTNNSSLIEVAGDAALFSDACDVDMLSSQLIRLWTDTELRTNLINKGKQRLSAFSWDTCAQDTLALILQPSTHS